MCFFCMMRAPFFQIATMPAPLAERLAAEISARPQQVTATIALLDDGATVPFIARYRKEVTGGLDDSQLRTLAERLVYLRDLDERRQSIINSVQEQNKLTAELAAQLDAATTRQALEDLYLPYKPKRRNKAQMAREAGLAPLAALLLEHPEHDPEREAENHINSEAGFADGKAVLDGARQILMEQMAQDAELLRDIRAILLSDGLLTSQVVDGQEDNGAKYRDWFNFAENAAQMPSHRVLALLRGQREGFLDVSLQLPEEREAMLAAQEGSRRPRATAPLLSCERKIAARYAIADQGRAADAWLLTTVRWAWRVKIQPHLAHDIIDSIRERAEDEAIRVFARNLKDLLLASPAGAKVTLGIDPGIRTGCKVAVIDATGKVLDTATIYPFAPRFDVEGSLHTLKTLIQRHHVALIAIGNGTASRESDQLTGELIAALPASALQKVMVSEAGASVYSASALGAREFPDLDVSLRGAVSIARRLQDPLAELVKIDPQSIGVGQYQHDVAQNKLARRLDEVVEDCVNAVGVDVNTASPSLLARVAGLSPALAENIVLWREEHGAFKTRQDLLKVPRLGAKTFEQAAGFLRIPQGDNELDASGVHPEAYAVVERMLNDLQRPLSAVLGQSELIARLHRQHYVDERFGLPTITDICKELEKPGRDPRSAWVNANFSSAVTQLSDLIPGMELEGVVTNVAAFGAFVDVGVHQDGLVHISALADRFVKDPHDVVHTGQVVRVTVLEVDLPRKRIALSMRSKNETSPTRCGTGIENTDNRRKSPRSPSEKSAKESPHNQRSPRSRSGFGQALSNALGDALARKKK